MKKILLLLVSLTLYLFSAQGLAKNGDVLQCVSSLLQKLAMIVPPQKKKYEVSGQTEHAQHAQSTILRSALRQIHLAKCVCALIIEPPGRMKFLSLGRPFSNLSISFSSSSISMRN